MKVLVACEYSGIVRDAFIAAGHDAVSCDLLPTEARGPHFQGDVLSILDQGWDLMIAHPPCTHLAISGARWFPQKQAEQLEALAFVKKLMDAPIPRICIENPVSIISTSIRKPDQIINPYQFGHFEKKRTCLWLKNLPPLIHTKVSKIQVCFSHHQGQSKNRGKVRAKTPVGIAKAMAAQWGQHGN